MSITPEGIAAAGPFPAIASFSAADVTAIVHRLFEGESQSRIARSIGARQHQISYVVHALGIENALSTHLRMGNARDAALLFNRTRRLRLVSELADHVEATLEQAEPGTIPAKDMRDLAVTTAVLIDKQRLEDGESTANQSVQVQVWRRQNPRPPTPDV